MKLNQMSKVLFYSLFAIALYSCSEEEKEVKEIVEVVLPAGYDQFTEDVRVTIDGEFMVISSLGVPNHKSPYWEAESPLNTAYDGNNSNFYLNGNTITEFDMIFRIPLNPAKASEHKTTPEGPIGVALNGVAFFNQYSSGTAGLSVEINTFDQYQGHPNQEGMYHYHIEPLYLTTNGRSKLLGYLLDGFPVYGPTENGSTILESDLDEFHGHEGTTPEYPDGIYHYHITKFAPYINGAGFYGTSGTVTF